MGRTPDQDLNHPKGRQSVHIGNFDPLQNGPQPEDDPSFSFETSEDGQQDDDDDDDDSRIVLEVGSEDGNLELDQEEAFGGPHAMPEQERIGLGQDCIPPGVLSNRPVTLQPQTQSPDSHKDEVINLLDADPATPPAEQSQPDSPEPLSKASPAQPLDDTNSDCSTLPEFLDKAVTSTLPGKAYDTGREEGVTANYSVLPPSQPKSADDAKEEINLDDDTATHLIKCLQEKGLLEKLVEQLGYQKARGSAVKHKKPTTAPSQAGENQVPCEKCDKKFHRPCELKYVQLS